MDKVKNLADMVLNFLSNVTLSEYEQEVGSIEAIKKIRTDNSVWIDHSYIYRRKRLEIQSISFCDGSYNVIIWYDKKLVFHYYDSEGDFEEDEKKIKLYKPGDWEKIIYKLDVRADNKQ